MNQLNRKVVPRSTYFSDAALPSAEYASEDFGNNIIGLSVRKPSTDLLTNMAGTGTRFAKCCFRNIFQVHVLQVRHPKMFRVIHLDWTSPNELFNSWFAYAICDYVTATTVKTPTTPTKTRPTVMRRITGMSLNPVETNKRTDEANTSAPPATIATPTNVEAVPKSPNSFILTWTCCTNTKSVLVLYFAAYVTTSRHFSMFHYIELHHSVHT